MIPKKLTLDEWDKQYDEHIQGTVEEPWYGGKLSRHLLAGDTRILHLTFDNSFASLNLWNFLLTEEQRLNEAKERGDILIGTMKDLGTVPVIAYAFDNATAFYPDGAWWIPCVMELNDGLFAYANDVGIDESFCPVRAMIGAYATGGAHFPLPDISICSVGAVCDDFSVIAQQIQAMGQPLMWWEIPHRREPEKNESYFTLSDSMHIPIDQIHFVKSEFVRIKELFQNLCRKELSQTMLNKSIEKANEVRMLLNAIRHESFTAPLSPMPALELLIAEMIAIHYCSDREQSINVLSCMFDEITQRKNKKVGYGSLDDAKLFWVNPVADISIMNIFESCGARLCGTDYLFTHALNKIPSYAKEDPLFILAAMALSDPMVGSTHARAQQIVDQMRQFGAEGCIVSKIPGASHCTIEGHIIARTVEEQLHLPVIEIEVPPLSESLQPAIITRIEAIVETIKMRRGSSI